MKLVYLLPATLLLLPLVAVGDEKPAVPYRELSQLIHKTVVAKVPKVHEDLSGWGGTIPIGPEKLRFPNLRTRLRVGDQEVFPHGPWHRYKVWTEEPAQDITIQVKQLRQLESSNWFLSVDSAVRLQLEGEFRQYQKGLLLVGVTANAAALVTSTLDFEIALEVLPGKLPPDVKVKPKVVSTKLDIADFRLGRLGNVEIADPTRKVDNGLRDFLSGLLKAQEPAVQAYANQAITRALEQGKGTISTVELFKLKVKK